MTDDSKTDCSDVSQAKLYSLEDSSKISFKNLKCENSDKEKEQNIYQKYIDEIKEINDEEQLCQHIKNLTQENFENAQLSSILNE